MFGWRAEEVIGRYAPIAPEGMCQERVQGREQILAREGLPQMEVSARKKDGSQIDFFLSAAPLLDVAGNLVGRMALYMDITERKGAEAALRHQASHDALTGLPNRALLHECLDRVLRAAQVTGQPVSLLLLDLDRFKEVNDTLGHHIGDLLLRHVATRLQQALGATETVARLGGDEFALVLPAADVKAAGTVARLVLETLEAPFQIEQHLLYLGGSIGLVIYPEHGTDAQTLLRHGRCCARSRTGESQNRSAARYTAIEGHYALTPNQPI